MRVDTGQSGRYLDFASRLTGAKFGPKSKSIAFFSDDRKLLSVVVYNAFEEKNCGISIATTTPKWCTKLALSVIFGYPFNQLGLSRVTATIREGNAKSLSLVKRLGFKREGELKQYYDNGESAMIYGLINKQSKWHEQK